MEQIFRPAEVLTLDRPEEAIKRFEELKGTAIQSADEFTIIRMKLIIGCGCGGNSENIFAVIKGNHTDLQRYQAFCQTFLNCSAAKMRAR